MNCVMNSVLYPWTFHEKVVESSYDEEAWKFVKVQVNKKGGSHEVANLAFNQITGNFYLPEKSNSVALKCFGITFATPVYMVARVVYQVAAFIIDLFVTFTSRIIDFCKKVYDGYPLFGTLVEQIRDGFIEAGLITYTNIRKISESVYYSFGMFIASIGGWTVDPFQARQQIAIMEKRINGRPRQYDVRYGFDKPKRVFYLGFCFQPFRNIKDSFFDGEKKLFIQQPALKVYDSHKAMVQENPQEKPNGGLSHLCPITHCCIPTLV